MLFFVFLIILISLIEYVGDSNFKFYSRSGKLSNLGLGVVAYGVMIYVLIKALSRGNVLFTNGMWDGISTIIATILAFYLLGERLDNNYQWVGLFLVITGTLLLSVGSVPK
jgi:multidrug transporter EmrE-like cation transporter